MIERAQAASAGPRAERITIPTDDGVSIEGTSFEPASRAAATVLVNGATAVPAKYYRRFATHLAEAGHRVVTYDYRGIGASRPGSLRGFQASMTDWARLDARAALAFARARASGGPVVLVGHSFGGQLLGLVDEARDVAGAVLVAAQLGWYGHWPMPSRMMYGLLWHLVVPSVTSAFGYLPGRLGIGEDLPRGVAEEWGRWCRHPEYLASEYPDAPQRFARFERPMLFYSFTDDDFAPRGAVRALKERLSGAQLIERRVAPRDIGAGAVGHFGFFRPAVGGPLWPEVLAFIDDVAKGREVRPMGPRSPWAITEADVRADLSYGRN